MLSETNEPVLSISDVARMLGISRMRYYQLQHAGKLPPPQRFPGYRKRGWTLSQAHLLVARRLAQLATMKQTQR